MGDSIMSPEENQLTESFGVLQILLACLLFSFCSSCHQEQTRFQLLSTEKTGIDFINAIRTDSVRNALSYAYIYNGGGVSIGDVNGDSLPDIFLTGNQTSSRLYLNKGGFQFKDVTLESGLHTDRWCTGAAMVDINMDGRMDIYVSVAGYVVSGEQRANYLFINQGFNEQGIPDFQNLAWTYGLADTGYSTQAAFLDFDLDGDIDMYLLTNALERYYSNNIRPIRKDGTAPSTDRLYRNNGDGTFSNVSAEAGITIEGYGLGVQVTDFNFDGFPDVYVSNDFISNDLLWINNQDGTFRNEAATYLKHLTHNGMGVDVGDLNNDALPDIGVVDMLPEGNYRQKMMIPYMSHDLFLEKKKMGYQDQYMRNTLQLHRGQLQDGALRFSEIGSLTGIAATDWSWSILFADFDHNGWKDIFISNGYRKDVTNLDFVNYAQFNQMFGTPEAREKKAMAELEQMPDVHVENYMYQNLGDLNFENVAQKWGLQGLTYSNGAAYGDLDLDGDLDLVTNNIDATASVYRNKTVDHRNNDAHFLNVQLKRMRPASTTLNAKVLLYAGGGFQYQDFSPYRGYQSSVQPMVHFGLDTISRIDSLLVFWPGGNKTSLYNLPVDQTLQVDDLEARSAIGFKPQALSNQRIFERADSLIPWHHTPDDYSDFSKTRTLLFEYDKVGPALAVGDLNQDGRDDLIAGGNRNQPSALFFQMEDGSFSQKELDYFSESKVSALLLQDIDHDGDVDLYMAHGGTCFPLGDDRYQDILLLNDGQGEFSRADDRIPEMKVSTGCVVGADYDADGDMDLFVGGRLKPGAFPEIPRSYLLEQDQGRFRDVTPPTLQYPGMVTSAIWTDFDQDGSLDLILVGEWMPIRYFTRKGDEWVPCSPNYVDSEVRDPEHTSGWWQHINAYDFDGDGDDDYLIGNSGSNNKLRASLKEPIELYAGDFDQNGGIDPLVSCYIKGEKHLVHARDLLIRQIPGMKRRFPDYDSYAKAEFNETLSEIERQQALKLAVYLQESVLLENLGGTSFRLHHLAADAQFAPVMTSVVADLNRDGMDDIILGGNYHATETTQIGWLDAGYGHIMIKSANEGWQIMSGVTSGLVLEGDLRSLQKLNLVNGGWALIAGNHGQPLQIRIYR